MKATTRVVQLVLAAATVFFGLTNCSEQPKEPEAGKPATTAPAGEHPKADHPTTEHPK